ncbi:hypothetical protein AQ883_01050 [Burkholderia pseudomallei]|nr:hypothetical protein BOC37_07965 [Burkholderia pseudomallei]OMZ43253.1 hypothetical protein AQ864_16410 [Burkholderia pseudomallei]OMZ61776.1 hypothetical protein AQ867_17890 [Burkholderia pseudomallei]OMZ85470.1 hypothetical protein AQ869_06255 [Burkholderia pseudomallei]ONA49357.1 hypothetical protein AQ882_19850 [Burkholderia pseudomallei]
MSGEHDVRRQVPNGSRGRAARSRRLRALAFVPGIGRAREQARARCGLGSAARRVGSVLRMAGSSCFARYRASDARSQRGFTVNA